MRSECQDDRKNEAIGKDKMDNLYSWNSSFKPKQPRQSMDEAAIEDDKVEGDPIEEEPFEEEMDIKVGSFLLLNRDTNDHKTEGS